jgi:hypothetical protein
MKTCAKFAILFALLPAAYCSRADANDKGQIRIDLQICKVRDNISGKTSLTDDIWEGIDRPANRQASQEPFSFFVTAEELIGKVKFSASHEAWTWDGKDIPPSDGPIQLVAAPGIISQVGNAYALSIQSPMPVEYFTKREDGLFERHEAKDVFTGLSITAKPEEGPSNRIILRDFSIDLSWVSKRKPIEGVTMDVGEPIVDRQLLRTTMSLLPDKYYGIWVRTDHQGMMLFRIKVKRVNMSVND